MLIAVALALAPSAFGWTRSGAVSGAGAHAVTAAIDSRGDVLVVWAQGLRGGSNALEVAARRSGGRFGAPRQLLVGPDVGYPELGYNGRGDVVILLSSRVADNCEPLGMCAQRLRVIAGDIHGNFARPVELTDDARAASLPALGPSGDAAVAWTTFVSNAPGDVLASRRTAGRQWGAPEPLGSAMFGFPSAAIDARGRTVVAWANGPDLHAVEAARGAPLSPVSLPATTSAAEVGVTLAPNGAGAIYWSAGATSRSAPMYALLARANADFRRSVRVRGGAGGAFVASAGGLLAYWSQVDRRSDIHRTFFDPFYALGSVRGMGHPRAAGGHGLVLGAGLDARGRGTLVLGEHHALDVVDVQRRHHHRSLRVEATDLVNVGFAEAPTGRAVVSWLSGDPPQHLRVFAAWR